MRSKKVPELILYPRIQGRQHYHFEGEETTHHRALPCGITELGRTNSFDILAKTDVVFLPGMEDLKAGQGH